MLMDGVHLVMLDTSLHSPFRAHHLLLNLFLQHLQVSLLIYSTLRMTMGWLLRTMSFGLMQVIVLEVHLLR